MQTSSFVRPFRREPTTLVAAIVILAFVSGAGIMVFALVDATLLKPLPYHDPERLVRIEAERGGQEADLSMRELQDLRERTELFDGLAAYVPPRGGYTMNDGDGPPHEASAVLVTHNLFSVLGVGLARGTSFPASYDLERSFGIVLNDRLFRARFGGDEAVLDQTLTLDGAPSYTVFGVTPEGFDFPFRSDLYRSIFINERSPNLNDRSVRRVRGIGRLATGVSLAVAQDRVAAVGRQLAAELPDSNSGVELRIVPLERALLGNLRPYLIILSAAAGLLLLIGSVNASNLLLTRALNRERELAVRAAIGASRARLALELLLESTRIALLGVVGGLAIGALGVALVDRLVRVELPSWVALRMDASVLPVALAAALALGLTVGLVTALRLSRVAPEVCLRSDRGGFGSGRQRNLVRGLLMSQIALALILLAAAGTLLESFRRLAEQDFGFEPESVLSFKVNLPWFTYSRSEPERAQTFHDRVLEGVSAIPGVRGAALTSDLPFSEGAAGYDLEILVEGQGEDEAEANPLLRSAVVSLGYFETMGVAVLEGRVFDSRDHAEAVQVALVNRAVAERFWPGESALGRRLKVRDGDGSWLEIVGVVDDIRRVARDSRWQEGLHLYRPRLQEVPMNVHYVARVAGTDPSTLVKGVERIVWDADPLQPIWDVETMTHRLETQLWRERTVAWLAGAFAVAALLLAAVGLFAALAESVRRRRREIGLRMAVGAAAHDIARLVLREAGVILAGGLGLGGLGLLLVVPRLARGSVFLEPPSLAQCLQTMLLLALLAAIFAALPTWRALRVDPTINLRAN